MNQPEQIAKAEAFRAMHDRSRILVLPNAWDAASALVFEEAGFKAIATTSSGIANALGYPDGQVTPRGEMLFMIGRIARSVTVPVTADIEAGYADDLATLKETIAMVIDAGAIGINLEDSMMNRGKPIIELDAAVARVRAAREAAQAAGVPIVINARTDVYLHGIGERDARFDDAVRRANAYREAGADSLFVPGVRDAAVIGKLAAALKGPLNILAGPGTPPASELEKLGVARVSVGGGPARAAMTTTRNVARELLERGTYQSCVDGVISHPEANKLMTRHRATPT
ncbi:MAG: isocitrate lyase/PEP mutase family protein [Candidatus Binataceae bacterium]